jgi:anti-sigma B factor antagonist
MTLGEIPHVGNDIVDSDPDLNLNAASPLRIMESQQDEGVRLIIAGELDISTAPFLRAKLDQTTQSLVGELVLDFGLVTFMGSTGLSVLVMLQRNLRARGASLKILNPTPMVARVIKLTGLDGYFCIEPPI